MRVGIIGGTGWLGGALGRALIAGGTLALGDLVILNRSGARDDYFGHRVVWAADLADLVARVDVVVISVRPQDWPGLEMKAAGRLVISFMAGVGMAALPATGGRVVRAMPNAAAEIGASYTPWVAGPGVTAADRARMRARWLCKMVAMSLASVSARFCRSRVARVMSSLARRSRWG